MFFRKNNEQKANKAVAFIMNLIIRDDFVQFIHSNSPPMSDRLFIDHLIVCTSAVGVAMSRSRKANIKNDFKVFIDLFSKGLKNLDSSSPKFNLDDIVVNQNERMFINQLGLKLDEFSSIYDAYMKLCEIRTTKYFQDIYEDVKRMAGSGSATLDKKSMFVNLMQQSKINCGEIGYPLDAVQQFYIKHVGLIMQYVKKLYS